MDESKLGYYEYLMLAKEAYPEVVSAHPELSTLSPRENEVFAQLLTDKTLSQIAEELFITYSSAHFHCKNIYKKLGVSSRKELLIKYKDL